MLETILNAFRFPQIALARHGSGRAAATRGGRPTSGYEPSPQPASRAPASDQRPRAFPQRSAGAAPAPGCQRPGQRPWPARLGNSSPETTARSSQRWRRIAPHGVAETRAQQFSRGVFDSPAHQPRFQLRARSWPIPARAGPFVGHARRCGTAARHQLRGLSVERLCVCNCSIVGSSRDPEGHYARHQFIQRDAQSRCLCEVDLAGAAFSGDCTGGTFGEPFRLAILALIS